MSGQQGGPIPLVGLGVPFPGTGERALVPVLIEIKGATLLSEQQGPLRFDVSAYALGAKNDLQATLVDTVELDLARLGPLLVRSGVKFVGELALLPGEYTVRVLVRERGTEQLGLRSFSISVPDFKSGAPYLSPPLFLDPPDTWLVARASALRRTPGGEGQRLPLLGVQGDSFPSARPFVAPGTEVPFEVVVSGLPPGTELRAEIRKAGGEAVADLPVHVEARRPTELPGVEIVSGSFEPDKKLEWGEREIRITAPGATGAMGAPRSAAVLAVLGDSGGKVWAEYGPGGKAASAVAAAATAEAPSRRRLQIDEKAIQAAYGRALLTLAGGDEPGAKTAVTEIEVPLLTGKNTLHFEEMADLEMRVAQSLGTAQPESLVPVMMLYELLYRDYLDRKQFLPAAHAGEMVFRLTDLYAQRAGTPEAKQLAANFLVGLAQGLVSTGVSGLSERAFKRALVYDESNQIALLSLAVHQERQSHYEQAVDYLQKLVRSHPEDAEGRLRLALNLIRLDKKKEAERTLAELAADASAPDWVVSLAYQELARALTARQELGAAEKVLEAALQRLPGDEKLLIQRSMLLDLRRDAGDARDMLAAVKAAPDPKQRSARRRYGELPLEALDHAWNALRSSVIVRLPSLAAAMAKVGSHK